LRSFAKRMFYMCTSANGMVALHRACEVTGFDPN
jgi:hypothetical protein